MEKTCKIESLPSRDWVCLYQERFPYHPQLSLRHGAEKVLVTTGFLQAGQVFLPLTMLSDWCSLVHWCPSSSTLSLRASLFPPPRKTAQWLTQMTLSPSDSASTIRGRGEMQTAVCSGGCWCSSSLLMWRAPQQGGHSDVFVRWGLAWELEGFITGEQGQGNSYRRYRKSPSCEQKKHTLHVSPLTENLGIRLISLDSSCLWCNWAITSLCTHK